MARAGATLINRGNGVIGELRSAMLSEADFQSQFGTEWVLADGADVTGSKYHTLIGDTTIPDARGLSLRGKNNGRVDGNQNPDGDVALGTFQNFGTSGSGLSTSNPGNHTHGTAKVGSTTQLFGMLNTDQFHNSGAFQNITGDGAHTHTISGANETRMRNITVNHFIKIN
jgi:hypothetical protein